MRCDPELRKALEELARAWDAATNDYDDDHPAVEVGRTRCVEELRDLLSRIESEPEAASIRVWRFQDAPAEYRELSTNGGDEDWLVLWPGSQDWEYGKPRWLEKMDSCEEPQVVKVSGGTVYIGSHA